MLGGRRSPSPRSEVGHHRSPGSRGAGHAQRWLSAQLSPEAQQQVAALAAHPPPSRRAADVRDLRQLLVVVDRQRHVARSRSARGRRAAAGRRDGCWWRSPTSTRSCRRTRRSIGTPPRQTTTVYTGVRNFPMLPEPLSTGATSLLEGGDRLAVVIEFVVGRDGHVAVERRLSRARPQHARSSTYDGVGAWLEGRGPAPPKVAASPDAAGAAAAAGRARAGAARASATVTARSTSRPSRRGRSSATTAWSSIEHAGEEPRDRADRRLHDRVQRSRRAAARGANVSSIRRVVKTPERWDRIVALAAATRRTLPADARFEGAERVPGRAQGRRSRSLRRSVAGGHQADGPGRVRARAPRRSGRRAISAWRSRTTRTRPRPTAASPTS